MFRRVSARAVEEAAQTASGPNHASDSESVLETERANLTDCLGALLDVGRFFDPGADIECSGLHCVSNQCFLFLKVDQHWKAGIHHKSLVHSIRNQVATLKQLQRERSPLDIPV